MRFFFLFIVLFSSYSLSAEKTSSNYTIKIAYNDNWFPFSYGKGESVDGELVRAINDLISDRLGVVVYNYGLPWKRAQAEVKSGNFDVLITVPTRERLKYTYSSQSPVFEVKMVAIIRTDSPLTKVLNQEPFSSFLNKAEACDTLGNGWGKTFYNELGLKAQLTNSIESCLKMINAKRLDFTIQAESSLKSNPFYIKNKMDFLILDEEIGSMKFSILISKSSRVGFEIMNKLEDAFKIQNANPQ